MFVYIYSVYIRAAKLVARYSATETHILYICILIYIYIHVCLHSCIYAYYTLIRYQERYFPFFLGWRRPNLITGLGGWLCPFPRRWDSKWSTKCKSKSWMLGRFESTANSNKPQISIWICTARYKFNQNLNSTLYREIPRNLNFLILTRSLKSPHHSRFRFAFWWLFRVSSCRERAVTTRLITWIPKNCPRLEPT